MKILHGTWIPENTAGFIQAGNFYLWVETTPLQKTKKKAAQFHPFHLQEAELSSFLIEELGLKGKENIDWKTAISPCDFLLPTAENQPIPSIELSRYQEAELPEEFEFVFWKIACYRLKTQVKTGSYSYAQVNHVIQFLNDLHFLTTYGEGEIQLGSDLFFWYHYTQAFKQVLLQDQYIPSLKYRLLSGSRKSKKSQSAVFEIYPGWEIVSEQWNAIQQTFVESMPLVCGCGFEAAAESSQIHDPESLLHHFSECLLTEIVTHTPSTAQFDKQIAGTLLANCLNSSQITLGRSSDIALEEYQKWQGWRQRISYTQTAIPFYLYFQLCAPEKAEESWELQFLVAPKHDPSLRLSLRDYWRLDSPQQQGMQSWLGKAFASDLLLNLGYAARIYPRLWDGLETAEPARVHLDLEEAFDFLKETAWVLESAGYKVIVPAWWTPTGRKRAKLRLKASRSSSSNAKDTKSYFGLDTLVQYHYQLAIGDQPVTPEEWQQLVSAKTSLVQFRGQWVELDSTKMQQMLEFWQTHGEAGSQMSLMELMQQQAEAGDEVEFERDAALEDMLAKLQDKNRLEPIEDLPQLQGTLRDYQKRGVAWLHYLETLGLNGCLADDMGLGKTVQVIARLVQEKSFQEDSIHPDSIHPDSIPVANRQGPTPTLLIAPTSVLGNWQKEIKKFAPHLKTRVHHGGDRIQDPKVFQTLCQDLDVLITSYTLIRKDAKLLGASPWHRIVLDEAQNIKNPKTAQTKEILKLSAQHRLALTGTPVENRLLDLWSIFNFLNPGYLGKQNQFRKSFEIPIQKENDRRQSVTLKKLVEPFILRRVKTDQSIIKDLPDKVEQKVYCNLTKEQASLYEAVVKDVEKQLAKVEVEGIQRKGLILSTLMKLKQICNHPRQFLQDESEFSPARSHKLSRLQEMLEEVFAEGESLLIFTQFREIGDALEQQLRHHHYNTYYIHGGTNRNKREQMIADFQDPASPPSAFILSLKAGGVGITLTKANHVFHFDRWWNPAVEDQATDRAFRIGQKKNVFVHKFVTLGSLEEKIDQMIEDKKKLSSLVVGADESWLTELDNDTFKQLIALNHSAILD
ncbi:MAG: DEAD/DEAH box helicase [Oscillatoriales cyanobacterium RM2_1_1]|nr:DEAD/DEAH box helicase [Oscillatoriales cyanobacterium SM2_3_0]NJO45517.1 DEAD/DEAH box helicase [Oscillatoriales cyanobacterium RM2_1_1]